MMQKKFEVLRRKKYVSVNGMERLFKGKNGANKAVERDNALVFADALLNKNYTQSQHVWNRDEFHITSLFGSCKSTPIYHRWICWSTKWLLELQPKQILQTTSLWLVHYATNNLHLGAVLWKYELLFVWVTQTRKMKNILSELLMTMTNTKWNDRSIKLHRVSHEAQWTRAQISS